MQTNFILYRDNFKLDREAVDQVSSDILSDARCGIDGYHSSFFIDDINERPEVVFVGEMMGWCKKALTQMSLIGIPGKPDRVGFNLHHWCQVYHGRHGAHDHFNAGTIISWVHFTRPTKQKCFYFLLNGEKYYPQQDEGDFIMFPPHALHGIDECLEDETRVTIAGNLMWEEYYHAPNIRQKMYTVRDKLFVSEVFE